MTMDKVIKEFNNDNFVYLLGYDLYDNKVYPEIEIYKNKELLAGGDWYSGAFGSLFSFYAADSFSNTYGSVGNIKELFVKLRKYSDISEYIENEFENIYILYKLNDFNEL